MEGMAVATLPDGIYIVGGMDRTTQSCSKRVARLDTETLVWSTVAELKVGRSHLTVASVGSFNYIYAIGGRTGSGRTVPTSMVERFDVSQNKWETVSPLTTARAQHAACLSTIIADNCHF